MKTYYNYQQIDQLIEELVLKIVESGRKFSVVVGIENGGIYISRKIATALGLEHRSVKISCYDGEILRENPIIETNFFHVDLYNGCLICDDLVDRGTTLLTFKEFCGFNEKDAVAVLFIKPNNTYNPDFWVQEETNWCVFPWEEQITS